MVRWIGIMIGMYIITRMIEIIDAPPANKKTTVVLIFAVLTAVAAGFALYVLFTGSSLPESIG